MSSPYLYQTQTTYSDIGDNLCLNLSGAMRMMQEAAIIHSDLSGYSVMDVERTRVVWMLVQWRVRLTGLLKWNEPVDVVTWPQTMEKLTSSRCFEIRGRSGEIVAKAESNWVLVNADTGRIMRIPLEVAGSYDLVSDGVFDSEMPKLHQRVGELMCSFTVRRQDLDTNRHVNNLVYLDYAREALPADLAEIEFREVVVRYHRQLLLGDSVCCYYEECEQGHLVQICGDDPRHVHCTVLFCD